MTSGGVQVLGLGRTERGDDGVGVEVVRRLRELGVCAEALSDPSALVERLDGTPTILVDAVLARPEGALVELGVDELAKVAAVSSHAMSVPAAVGLAEVLHGPTPVRILGITIRPPGPAESGLSPAVCAAADAAVLQIQAWLESPSNA